MEGDISRRAVLILVVIAVLSSLLTTTLVLNPVYHYSSTDAPSPVGRVTLSVPSASPTGQVTLQVFNPNEQVKG